MGITMPRSGVLKINYLYLIVFIDYFNIGIVIAISLMQLPGANN